MTTLSDVDRSRPRARQQRIRKCAGLGGALAIGMLSACGDNGPQTPQVLQGKWGADCAVPFIQFEGSKIHVFPDDADYTVTKSEFDGKFLTISYDTAIGPATEIYSIGKDALVLQIGHYRDMDVTWHKQPMKRCSA